MEDGHDDDEEDMKSSIRGREYASGTNATYFVTVTPKPLEGQPPVTVSNIKVKLIRGDGTDEQVVYDGNGGSQKKLKLRFDSTHYEDATPVRICIEATSSADGHLEDEFLVTVMNRVASLRHPDQQYVPGHSDFGPIDTQPQYRPAQNLTTTWDKSVALEEIEENTVLFVTTHGTSTPFFIPGSVGKNDPTTNSDVNKRIRPVDATAARQQAKALDHPPIAFAFMMCCLMGSKPKPTGFFSSIIKGDEVNTTDRAIVTWKPEGWIDEDHKIFARSVFTSLSAGKTLKQALDDNGATLVGSYNVGGPVIYSRWEEILRIEGDHNMTLRGLYNGSGNVWFECVAV